MSHGRVERKSHDQLLIVNYIRSRYLELNNIGSFDFILHSVARF
jgi:hypothetical protein